MSTLAGLHAAVTRTLATKRLGAPVFVRYVVDAADKPGNLVQRLAQLTAVVRTWLGQTLERVYATGSEKSGHATVTLEFAGAATAVLSCTSGAGRTTSVDLTVIGNHGAMYHDAGSWLLVDDAAALQLDAPAQELVTLIERALKSGRPESAGGKR